MMIAHLGRRMLYLRTDLAVSGVGFPTSFTSNTGASGIRTERNRTWLTSSLRRSASSPPRRRAKDADTAQAAAYKANRLLDKAASKGIIHKNQAAERKSGVQRLVNTLS